MEIDLKFVLITIFSNGGLFTLYSEIITKNLYLNFRYFLPFNHNR